MSSAVQMTGIDKRFGPVVALDGVDFEAVPGEIHSLVGENGAGKTTLMRVLYGALRADGGTVELGGTGVAFANSAEAIRARIGMVSQHYSIIPRLTCLENLVLGAEGGPTLRRKAAKARAQELAMRMGFAFEWDAHADALGPAGAQKLEILKLLWRDSRVMILDEPTAMLSPADSDALYASLESLAADGCTVIVVTHRLAEVLDHAARVTVLRGGRLVRSTEVAQTDGRELASWIVGHEMHPTGPSQAEPRGALLSVSALEAKGDRGDLALKGAGFTLSAGEVVGLAGVDGNGQRELFQVLVGVRRALAGSLSLGGRNMLKMSPAERIAAGLRLIPEDRHAEGLIENASLEENASLGLQRLEPLRRGIWLARDERRRHAQAVVERFATRAAGLDAPAHSLSGGNQQRFVAARALSLRPEVLLAFQPARGLDIDSSAQVYAAITEMARAGSAALVVSFDLDELLERCDRVLVMQGGRVLEPPADQAKDRAAIGCLMVGAT